MAEPIVLERLAAEVLDVSVDTPDDEVEDVHRDLVTEVHPDVSDAPNAAERFKAVNTAKDILVGDFDFADRASRSTAKETMSSIIGDEMVREIEESADTGPRYTGTAQKRTDPTGFDMSDFSGAGPDERAQMVKTVSLGVETMLVYQGVSNLYKTRYIREDFFEDVNDYIDTQDPERISYRDYYEATKEDLRQEVTREVFINSIQTFEEGLEQEYGQDTTISEVARIIAYFIVQGGVDIGLGERFIQSGAFGRDERFSRGRPSSTRFGRDERFGR